MRSNRGHQAGFSLLEALVATTITVTVTAGVFTVLGPSRGLVETQPEFADMQQRLRVFVDTLRGDLVMAGAGAYAGASAGSLAGHFAPILPFRRGSSAAYDDGPGVFSANAVTIVYVPSAASQTTIRAPVVDAASVEITSESGCPVSDPPCGFKAGTPVVVYDGTGAFDAFSVAGADATGTLALQHMPPGWLAKSYAAGSTIAAVVRRTYFLDAASLQLMRYDGSSSASVVLDNVVGLEFEYYGEPGPPAFRHAGLDQSVTYGPAPPVPDATQRPWPPGENCTWQATGGEQAPRLGSLGPAGSGLVKLTPAQLTDGPWCPDADSENRYDADLFRIRRVRVTVRLQTGNPLLRLSLTSGRGALFANAGTAMSVAHTVPDQSIRFDVSPRNMNLSR